jgi:hypothetical protein
MSVFTRPGRTCEGHGAGHLRKADAEGDVADADGRCGHRKGHPAAHADGADVPAEVLATDDDGDACAAAEIEGSRRQGGDMAVERAATTRSSDGSTTPEAPTLKDP